MSFHLQSVVKVVSRLLEDLSGPVALKAAILLRYEDFEQLVSMRVDPKHYLDWEAERFWRDTSAVSLLRKCQGLPINRDLHRESVENFFSLERMCYRSNLRLAPYLRPGLYQDENKDVSSYFGRVRKIISKILGPLPDLSVLDARFGPGATYGDKGRYITVPDKISSKPTLTSGAICSLPDWSHSLWAKAHSALGQELLLVEGNRFTSVPKDCTKNRGIAVEPSINSFYQLGFGRFIRSRLRRVGIDLTNGQDIHRQVACEASIRGHLATVDLRNASDTISKNLVKILLPERWFSALDSFRSPRSRVERKDLSFDSVNGDQVFLEKFSSMGNGFTFELETLIFLSLIWALDESLIPGKDLFVYGDDIIVPTRLEGALKSCFSFCGFELNSEKSFFSGPFRESCGGDYFNGTDVRPFFLKELPSEPQHWIAFANGIRRSARTFVRRFLVRRAWFSVLDALPNAIRSLRGPEELGDIVIHDDPENWRFRVGEEGFRWFRVYRPIRPVRVSWNCFSSDTILAGAVYGLPWADGWISTRGSVEGYKIGRVPYS